MRGERATRHLAQQPLLIGRAIRTRADEEAPAILADYMGVALSGIAEYPMTEAVVSLARGIGSSRLRSLDAIHLPRQRSLTQTSCSLTTNGC